MFEKMQCYFVFQEMVSKSAILFLVAVLICTLKCQANSIKPTLVECYAESASGIEKKPPATLNIFLEIIRRIEDANPLVSARDLSNLILQR